MLGLVYGMLESATNFQEELYNDPNYDPINPTIKLLKEKPAPKGAKQYFFNSQGEFSTEQMLKEECVFKCVAINDKSAIKKFQKWNK